jgi:Uma2 family endonuclease
MTDTGAQADWMFVIEPEIRSLEAFSRLVPDLAGWPRSTTGWPDLDATPVSLIPDWVAEIVSPATESFDRGPKKDAFAASDHASAPPFESLTTPP